MFANVFGGCHQNVECGLIHIINKDERITKPAPVPLQSVNVVASVVHAVAQVQVTQVFVNKEEQPIEAIYYFPVDSNGAVTHFEAELEGRTIKGVVKAHEEAKQEYEEAIKQNQTAFLGEENKPDIFKVRVGFLKPGSQAKIVIGYTTEVKNEKGSNSIRFFIPTTVAPRYVPERCTDEKSKDLPQMEFSESSPAPLSINVNVSIQGSIKAIASPTHEISVTQNGPIPQKSTWSKATVELLGKTTDMDRDFVLLVTPQESHKPRLYSEKFESSLVLMAHLIPSFKLDEQNVELVFVLDRSGSMQGESIELARKALILFLHSLPMDCYFNIVGFGSNYELLFPKSVKYDDGTLKVATEHAKKLRADLGGTNILEPLKEIYAAERIPGYLRQIFVLTDGEVGNTDEVIGLTKATANESRVFSLGIGDGASHHLVEGIAQAGGGSSAFVTYKETIDKKVLQQLKDAMQPSLTNVNISWDGVETPTSEKPKNSVVIKIKTLLGYGKPRDSSTVEVKPIKKSYRQAPEKIPPIFDGSQLVVFGVFGKDEIPTGATITAESPDGPLSVQIELTDDTDVGSTGMLPKLSAIKIVREIELKVAALGFTRHGRPQEEELVSKEKEGYKKEIIEIAVSQGITSKYTSFVAVDSISSEKVPDNWAVQTRFVPSQLAHGWNAYMSHRGGGSVSYNSVFGGSYGGGSYVRPMMTELCATGRSMFFGSAPQPVPMALTDRTYCGVSTKPMMTKLSKSFKMDDEALSPCEDDLLDYECEDVDMTKNSGKVKDSLEEVVIFQSFNGAFNWSESLIRVLGLDINQLKQEAEKAGWDKNGWATALVLAYFSEKLSDKEDSWELVALKAKKWLSKNCAEAMEDMSESAKNFFKST